MNPQLIRDGVLFFAVLLLVAAIGLVFFDIGRVSGVAECKPVPIKKMSYDMSKRELRRWIKYELARGV